MSILKEMKLKGNRWMPIEIKDIGSMYLKEWPSHNKITTGVYSRFLGSYIIHPLSALNELPDDTSVKDDIALMTLKRYLYNIDDINPTFEEDTTVDPIYRVCLSSEVDWDNVSLL